MTGQEIQDKVDKIVLDLQTTNKGGSVEIMLRSDDNTTASYVLSSDAGGNVNAGQLTALQAVVNTLKPVADAYEAAYTPVQVASEAYRTAREAHQVLIDASSAARTALSDALEADAAYQTAKADYETAREDAAYINARTDYKLFNVSENYGNIGEARGKYI